MFADLMFLFLASSFLKWMNANVIDFTGHSILVFSIVIPISVIVSFRNCMTSDSDVPLWNPVIKALSWFWSSRASSLLFTYCVRLCQGFLCHIHDSFTGLLVSVIFFFLFVQWLGSCHGAVFRLNTWFSAEICPYSRRFSLNRFL